MLKRICQEFFYTGNTDCLAALFPNEFIDIPIRALTLVATAVSFFFQQVGQANGGYLGCMLSRRVFLRVPENGNLFQVNL